jgi:serine/threonine-protein kinase
MFWPEHDTPSARAALRKVIHHLRETLGEAAILTRGDEEVQLDPAVVWCDVAALRAAQRRGAHAEALALYTAPLLDGFHANAPDFERLVAAERRDLAELAASLAWQLADTHDKQQDATQAGRYARSASRMAGDDERLLRKAMRLLQRNGDVAGALAIYEEFAARLRDEYDATPSAETQALAQSIRQQTQSPGAP